MQHPQMHEEFLQFESKVNQVMTMLEDMSAILKGDSEQQRTDETEKVEKELVKDEWFVTVTKDRSIISKSDDDQEAKRSQEAPYTMDQYTFMQQIEKDADERAKVRKERMLIAQSFRIRGNDAFRRNHYEEAILNYTRAIEHIKDSPILYTNRALSYVRLKNYKRAIYDCDYVITKLDEKNLRAWLYRAGSFKRLGDMGNYDASIKFAKKHNTKEHEFINKFVSKISESF